MTKRNIILISLGIISTIIVCAGIFFAGFFAFSLFDTTTDVDNSDLVPSLTNIFSPEEDETIETEITDIIEIDHDELFSPFWETWSELHNQFVDQPIDNQVLAEGAISGLELGLELENIERINVTIPENSPTSEELSAQANTPKDVQNEFDEFWEIWNQAIYASQGKGITYEYLMQSALSGMVESLGDPHTAYMDPNQFRQSQMSLDGEYDGIGAWVDTTTEFLTIVSPMEGSPAEQAGLKPGDRVIAVDGDDMTGLDGNLVIRRILGPAGSKVILTIDRDEVNDPFDVEITRAHIVIPNVEYEMLDDNIGYVQLQTFGAESASDIHDALEELLAQNPKGIILDLRNNGGGFLTASVSISSEFISNGPILFEVYGDGSRQTWDAISGGLATDIPLVVLVNEGSASASEIVAGAIQDTGRGVLVGTTTFGKGSVQTQVILENSQGAVRITIARWLTPNENLIHEIGLEPDYYIEMTDEDIEAELDPQLDKAIELLSSP